MTAVTERPVSRRDFVKGAAAAAATVSALAAPVAATAASKPADQPDRPLYDLEVWEAARLIETRSVTATEIALATLERIAAVEPTTDAFVLQYPKDEVLAQAKAADRLLRQGTYLGPLHGIPVGLKDIYFTKGKATEGNSRLYAGFVPGFDATSVAKLKKGGAVILGKTGTSELATAAGWPGKNPWDVDRQAGGSSTGSAVGVAASEMLVGMGTCTGGSIRGPAANNGITGFKPTHGTISLWGVFPLAWTMDHPGPLVRSALDAALVTDVCGGHDPRDPHSRPVARYRLAKRLLELPRKGRLRGVVVGVPAASDYFLGVPSDDELAAFHEAVGVIRRLGATVREVTTTVLFGSLTSTSNFYNIIRSAEVAAFQYVNLISQPQNMSQEYLDRVASGVLMPGHAYEQAQRVRRLWREKLLAVFEKVDVLIHPADNIAGLVEGENPPGARPSSGSKTNPWNLSGAPAVAIPTGLSPAERMPLSMQCVAEPGNDQAALLVAHAFQTATGFHRLRPPL